MRRVASSNVVASVVCACAAVLSSRRQQGLPLTLIFHHGQRRVKVVSVAVEDIVLSDEDDIERDTDKAKAKLDGVTRYARPVARDVGIEDELRSAQDSSSKIQEDVANAPADSGARFVVDVNLRAVLDEADGELDVAQVIKDVNPFNRLAPSCQACDRNRASYCAKDEKFGGNRDALRFVTLKRTKNTLRQRKRTLFLGQWLF